ncbi:type VI secretion system baseplate subunit TssG [Spongorhabdus nitratireducens]
MSTSSRLPAGDLAAIPDLHPQPAIKLLLQQPRRFEFRQAMRLLYREHDTHSSLVVTLRSSVVSSWVSWDIESIRQSSPDSWHLTITRPALTGARATLPFYMQDINCLQLWENHSRAMADLFQCFDSPVLLRDYRCTVKHQLALLLEESHSKHELCPDIEKLLLRLAGLHPLKQLPARHLIRFAGLLSCKPASVAMLSPVLEAYFSMPVTVESGPLQREPVESDCLSRVHRYLRQNNQLGHSLMIGDHTTLYCSRINIIIHPDSSSVWIALRNDTQLVQTLLEIARTCMGIDINMQVYARLQKSMLEASHVAQKRKSTMRLGRFTVLGKPENAPDTVTVRLT